MKYLDIYKVIGEKIRDIRLNFNLTLEEVASRAGISSIFLGNIERNEKKPSIDTLLKISNALKIPVDKLIAQEIIENPASDDDLLVYKITNYLNKLPENKLEKIYKIIKNL